MEDHKNEEKQNLKNIIDILLNKLNELINMSYPEEIKKFLPISSITIMKDIIEFEKINIENQKTDNVVIACGVARYSGERNVAGVFDKADKRMYENKKQLKNTNIHVVQS